MDVNFAEYRPDAAALESGYTNHLSNVLAKPTLTYGPVKALSNQGTVTGTERIQGAGSFRGTDGTVVTFCGTATKLLLWTGTGWSDITRAAGGAYACPTEGRWVFEQFGADILATNGVDVVQVYTIGSSTQFAALSGTPPVVRYLATVRDFIMTGHQSTDIQGLRWASQFSDTAWTIGVNQADEQALQNKGRITGLQGGQYAVVFQERGITLGTYVGPDPIFQFDEVSQERGCIVPGSISRIEQKIIFLDNDGFYKIEGGQVITPISRGKIESTLWANINQTYLYRCWSFIDQRTNTYYFTYPSVNSSSGDPDSILACQLDTEWWTPLDFGVDVLFGMFASLSVDLDTDVNVADQDLDGAGLVSLDSELYFGSPIPKLAAFNSSFYLCFFEGDNLAAELDTVEAELAKGRRAFVDTIWPKIDGGTLSVKLGTRNRPNDTVTWGSSVSQNNSGECRFRSSAKAHRARVIISAGSTWTHAQGVNFSARMEGDR